MINVNACHPSFDLTMELLCCLPVRNKHEGGALVARIVDDLGFRSGEIVRHFHALSERYDVQDFDLYGVQMMAVAPMGWLQARTAAQRYWDAVYGEPQNANTTRLAGWFSLE